MNLLRLASVAAALLVSLGSAGQAQTTLRIGLAEDPDLLDPTLARTYVGRIVFAGLCDKLFDITSDLKIVPQLATGYSWSADNKALTDTGTDPRGVRRPTRLPALCALTGASADEIAAVIDVFREPSRSFLMPTAAESLTRARAMLASLSATR